MQYIVQFCDVDNPKGVGMHGHGSLPLLTATLDGVIYLLDNKSSLFSVYCYMCVF